jgi:hypothetical protein
VSKPVIDILDGDILYIEANNEDNYVDAGAECSDLMDGDLNRDVRVSGDVVDLRVPGTYAIRYNCVNSAGVSADTELRIVYVRDMTCPVCTPNPGPDEVEASFAFHDPGVSCVDSLDGPITNITVDNTVDTNQVGNYTITYLVHDAAGNSNDGTSTYAHAPNGRCFGAVQNYVRHVAVVDTLKPVLALAYPGQIVATGDASDRSTAKGAAEFGQDHANPMHQKMQDLVAAAAQTTELMAERTTPHVSGVWFAAAIAAAVSGFALLAYSRRESLASARAYYVPV